MAKKRCPQCGKRVAPSAPYCIYCTHRFEDRRKIGKSEEETVRPETEDVVSAADAAAEVTPLIGAVETAQADISETVGENAELNEESPFEVTDEEQKNEDESEETDSAPKYSQKKLAIYGVIIFAVIAAVLLYVLAFGDESSSPNSSVSDPTTGSSDTVNTTRQDISWLQRYADRLWVDENSVGKRDVSAQGGYIFTIRDITNEYVVFDLYAYVDGECAFVEQLQATPKGDDVPFSFENDGFGHGGTGNLHFRENAIDADVIVNDNDPLPENAHSLAMDTVLVEQVLPTSDGVDVAAFENLESVTAVAGEQTAQAVTENDITRYSFDMLSVAVGADGALDTVTVEYIGSATPAAYCYECIDGTMTYDTVKTYYGKAEQDYDESPTDIRVLKYVWETGGYVQFTFDAQTNLLIRTTVKYS